MQKYESGAILPYLGYVFRFWIFLATKIFLDIIAIISSSILILILVVDFIFIFVVLPRLENGTPANEGRLDEMAQSDVVDHDDGEMQTRLDNQQEVGVDVQVAEEDDRRSVDEVVEVGEYFEGENDKFERRADQVHVADDRDGQSRAEHRRLAL